MATTQTNVTTPRGEDLKDPIPQAAPTGLLEQVVEKMEELHYQETRFAFQQRRARLFSMSGMFGGKDLTEEQSIAQAMVRIELGEAMGFSAAESMQGIDVIQGRPAISSALRAARMQAAGYSWDIDWFGSNDEPTGVRLWLYLNREPLLKPLRNEDGTPVLDAQGVPQVEHVSIAYLRSDAQRMLTTMWDDATKSKRRCSILEKDNWKMSPRNMYFARVIANAQRWYAPGVLNANLLSVEEAQDIDPEREPSYGPARMTSADVARQRIRELGGNPAVVEETKQEHDDRLDRQSEEQYREALAREQKAQDARQQVPPTTAEEAGVNAPAGPSAPQPQPQPAPAKASPFARPKFGGRG